MLFLTESTLFFVNLLLTGDETDRKPSLAGTVKGWAALVHEKTQETSKHWQSSEASASAVSGSSNQPSKTTNATTVGCLGTQALCSEAGTAGIGIHWHFGGPFDDSDSADDRMEREAMLAAAKNGKGRLNNNVVTLVRAQCFTVEFSRNCSTHG